LLNKLECFVLSKFFQASVIFVGKARACQSEAPQGPIKEETLDLTQKYFIGSTL
jgi:hypothetical protein